MPKLSKQSLDLKVSFADSSNNVYQSEASKSLRLWARMTANSPTDLSKNSLDPTYDGTPTLTNQLIGFNPYYAANFLGSANAQVTAAEGLLSFSSAGDGGTSTSSTDMPFSVSMWVKMISAPGTTEALFSKNGPTTDVDIEYYAYINVSGDIYFELHDTSTGGTNTQVVNTSSGAPGNGFTLGEWNHLVFTYDGRGGTSARDGMKIYIDTTNPTTANSAAGSYAGMQPGYSNPLYIGANRSGGGDLTGEVSEFALWSTELKAEEILAIYNTTRTTFYQLVSGYLNNPLRTVLRNRDNATGSYPSIKRTTGFRLTSPSNPFNDTRVINFISSSDVIYPMVLDRPDFERYQRNWIPTPNISASFGYQTVAGIVKPGLSDQGIIKSVNQSPGFSPFDESRVYLDDTSFYLTGTSASVIRGFSSPLKDKVQIHIDLSRPTQNEGGSAQMMSRYAYEGLHNDLGQALTGTALFFEKNYTGMRYFNFVSRDWDQIGSKDPGTDDPFTVTCWQKLDETPYNDIEPSAPVWLPEGHHVGSSAKDKKHYQFGMSPHLGYMAKDMKQLRDWGYGGIGCPTIAASAPFTGSYHATSSQQLNMSDYIDRPFLLEKAVLDIGLGARRLMGKVNHLVGDLKVDEANRDIDNLVFFVYRQRNPTVTHANQVDSPSYCSSSVRFLVMSASMAFYNSNVFNKTIREELTSSGLPHTPSFAYDWAIPLSGAGNAGISRTFGPNKIRLEMSPAVASARRGPNTRFGTRMCGSAGCQYFPTITIQDYWAGGTTFPYPGRYAGPGIRKFRNPLTGWQDYNANVGTSKQSVNSFGWGNSLVGSFGRGLIMKSSGSKFQPSWFYYDDTRPITSRFGGGDLEPHALWPFYPSPNQSRGGDHVDPLHRDNLLPSSVSGQNLPTATDSPYLLFPGDKLVFGLDAGISMVPMRGSLWDNTGGPTDFQRGKRTFSASLHVGAHDAYEGHARGKQCSGAPSPPSYSLANPYGGNVGTAMSSSFFKIGTGNASLTLYGSFVKRDRENLFQLDQNLTSNAIHEDIHYNNTVLDQFQIHSRKAYTGSYIDNFIIGRGSRGDGSPNLYGAGRPAVQSTITRYVASSLGSGTGSIEEFYGQSAYTIVGDPNGISHWNQALRNTQNRGSFFRGVKAISDAERSFDSILPQLTDFAERSGMTITQDTIPPRIVASLNGNLNEGFISGSDSEGNPIGIPNKKAYPYDTEVNRALVNDVILMIQAHGLSNANLYDSFEDCLDYTRHQPMSGNDGTAMASFNNALSSKKNSATIDNMFFRSGTRLLFSGGYPGKTNYYDDVVPRVDDGCHLFQFSPPMSTGSYSVLLTPGGAECAVVANHGQQMPSLPWGAQSFLYGIENVGPLYSSAVFRYDRFGQFRDMLEQRKDRKYYNSINNTELDSVIQCIFVSSSDGMTVVSPYDTQSSNMSQFATSSRPFFDGDSVNRTPLFKFTGISLLSRTGIGSFRTMFNT